MTQEQIIEGNKSIDEFMDNWLTNRGFSETELNYNSDWNCLMKVVEKIESIKIPQIAYGFELNMLGKRCVTFSNSSNGKDVVVVGLHNYNKNIFYTKLQAVWLAVVEFIKWYNTNK